MALPAELILASEGNIEEVFRGVHGFWVVRLGEIEEELSQAEVIVSVFRVVSRGVLILDIGELDLELLDSVELREVGGLRQEADGDGDLELGELLGLVGLYDLGESLLEEDLEFGDVESFESEGIFEFVEVG